jgi:hypothetical protein
MQESFSLPAGLLGRFAVVKMWPELKAAEDECIARLKIAASTIGLECFEIYADGRLLEDPHKVIARDSADFALHLHFDTPKAYDAFSFVALWNPIHFYHEWGYGRTSRNLLTHDDFISCSSTPADDHVRRLIRRSAIHLPPLFNLYHSVADIVHAPSLGEHKLFYAGINWDVLRGGRSRHQELLKRLDKTGNLRIFGPHRFQGVNVWAGYQSYVRELPFDGISMIHEISKAGIALVLSSQAHKDSELMSSRLFESVAAGALVICDENKFAKKFFEDSLLYIDGRCSVEDMVHDIERHLNWARTNPDAALAKVAKAQDVFRQQFSLKKNLADLYRGLADRKRDLLQRQKPQPGTRVRVALYLLMPEYSDAVMRAHIASAVAQEYEDFVPVLVIDRTEASENESKIQNAVREVRGALEVLMVDFFDYGEDKKLRSRRNIGAIIAELLGKDSQFDALVFVAPNERIFSNHLRVLAGSLTRSPDKSCAATSAIVLSRDHPTRGVHERVDFLRMDPSAPIGYARFMFRVLALPDDLDLALPYLDRKAMAILVGEAGISAETPATVLLDAPHQFPSGPWDEVQENELVSSFCPAAFAVSTGHEIGPPPSRPTKAEAIGFWAVRLLSWRWLQAQAKLVRQHGLATRLQVLKRKLKSRQA